MTHTYVIYICSRTCTWYIHDIHRHTYIHTTFTLSQLVAVYTLLFAAISLVSSNVTIKLQESKYLAEHGSGTSTCTSLRHA